MNINAVTVRTMNPAEQDDVVKLRVTGFGGETEQVREAFIDNPRFNISDVLVAEYQNQIIGTATVFPAQMWLSGVPLSLGAVAGVTVRPEFQNNGVAAKLMNVAVSQMETQGWALSALFPFSHSYYRKFGYGLIGDLHAYRIQPDNIIVSKEPHQVRPFSPDDLPMMRVIYKGQLTWHNGWFTRKNGWWDKLVEKWPNIMVYEDDEMIEGYFFYELKTEDDGHRTLHINEFFASSAGAYQGLTSYLATQNKADNITYLAPPDTPLRHTLQQPVEAQAKNRGWIFNDLCHVTPGPMGRIINLSKALTARFYTRGLSGERVLKVHDPLLPANEELISFRVVDGRAETKPAPDQKPQIETDIATLSQILCGYLKAVNARGVGRLEADEDTCSWLDKAIADAPLYIQAGDWF